MEASIVVAPGATDHSGYGRYPKAAGSGRGKQGGIRTIYFYHAGPEAIYLLTAYAKSDRDDLTPADAKALSRIVAEIKKERTGR